jgi:hypothetical protein
LNILQDADVHKNIDKGLIIGWVVYFAAMFRLWFGIPYPLIIVFFFIEFYGLISDPYGGPAVITRQGRACPS